MSHVQGRRLLKDLLTEQIRVHGCFREFCRVLRSSWGAGRYRYIRGSVQKGLCIEGFDPCNFLLGQDSKLPFTGALGQHAVVLVKEAEEQV